MIARSSENRSGRAPRGFTLLEIMVSIALLLVLIGATFGVLIAVNNSSQRIYRIANTQETARLALDALASDIRGAGLGISAGQVGVAPGPAGVSVSIPVIFSGPDMVVQQPYLRSSLITNSIFIISAEPTTLGLPADGTGLQGGVTDAGAFDAGGPLEVLCLQSDGGPLGCESGTSPIYLGAGVPLLIGDLRYASVITPLSISASGNTGAELLKYKEAGIVNVDPRTNNGVPTGDVLARLRIVHWYLRQDDPSAPPRLYRSKPVLSSAAFTCGSGTWPFQDETTGNAAVVGVDMGAGPVQSLQLRYVLDLSGVSDTGSYQMANAISACGGADIASNIIPQATSKLREVRVQVVALSTQPDLTTSQSTTIQIGYTTPPFESSLWQIDGGTLTDAGPTSALTDPYPRRAFNVRVVPRALQGVRL